MEAVPQEVVDETFSGESTSLSLIDDACKGNKQAWDRFVSIYTPLVYSNLRRLGLSETDAADVSQDVFSKVFQKLEKFDPNHPNATFRGWLATVVRNTCYSHFRVENRSVQASGGTDMNQLLKQVPEEFDNELLEGEGFLQTSSDDQILMSQALKTIKDDFEESTWKAFWMLAIEERPSAEVAESLGKSNAAVRKSKQRVMHRIKETLGIVSEGNLEESKPS